jgi:outer membrane receptor protein involved in Fe transport
LNIYDEIVLSDKYPSYYTIDAKISKEIFNNFQISITAQNILDKKFYDSKMLVCPGRFITAEIKVKF